MKYNWSQQGAATEFVTKRNMFVWSFHFNVIFIKHMDFIDVVQMHNSSFKVLWSLSSSDVWLSHSRSHDSNASVSMQTCELVSVISYR